MGDDAARPTMAGTEGRCIALVGPYLGGKTTLLEALLARTEVVARQGKVSDGNTLGDASPEARSHQMSVEMNVASATYLGDNFTFLDIPGSIEFQHEGAMALNACDAAVVVCEPDPKRVPALQLTLKRLEELGMTDLYRNVEIPLAGILMEMERAGVALDVRSLGDLSSKPKTM